MPRRAVFGLCLFFLLQAASVLAGGFDCTRPPYGTPLKDINDHDYFVKFDERGGIAYYNYTGPCRLILHEQTAPIIVYGVVAGKLYNRIVRTDHDDLGIITSMATKVAGPPKETTEGDWTIRRWDFPDKNVKMKVKYNNVTQASKSTTYYEPLRPKTDEAVAEKFLDK
ncbi:hypothetical protein DFW101_3292 [Solidesulfovibrio carbinoliphilus subsp. oakridgensis]|uniref:Lipoprotein n=1 Tax=Solidesulfovibrio carbinoliphilus subsp. oakridgensis TaxID=694327 RepID=G7QAR0_9BACT|nr:hypothetical protein [Solidesulfovibrio carbinoliphilus]EHJ49291.1 hypothetical protein DFW101_3292 [Solidesulfovibrio carbinoliphilus subsp. oakridgensis]